MPRCRCKGYGARMTISSHRGKVITTMTSTPNSPTDLTANHPEQGKVFLDYLWSLRVRRQQNCPCILRYGCLPSVMDIDGSARRLARCIPCHRPIKSGCQSLQAIRVEPYLPPRSLPGRTPPSVRTESWFLPVVLTGNSVIDEGSLMA